MLARVHQRSDQGETLIELLVSIAILGVCVVAIGSGIAGAVMVSGLHRDQADATRILHNYAETLKATTYVPCATPASYSLPAQSGFLAPTLTIAYWSGSSFGGTCSSDQGLQRVTITVTNTDNRVSDSLTTVLRAP